MKRSKQSSIVLLFIAFLLAIGCGRDGESRNEPTTMSGAAASGTTSEPTGAISRPQLETRLLRITASTGEEIVVEAEIADSEAERRRGLMERTALADNAGMLFVFEQERQLSFWMKNTIIPLSIAYIDAGGRIVDIQDMQPLDETSHPSDGPAQYALEVNQGFFEENGIEVGDRVELPASR